MHGQYLAVTETSAWADTGQREPGAARTFRRGTDVAGPVPVGALVLVEAPATGRAGWWSIGDSDFATNLHVDVLGNRDLLLLAAEVAARGDGHADGGPPPAVDHRTVLDPRPDRSPGAHRAVDGVHPPRHRPRPGRRRRRAASEAGGVTTRRTLGWIAAALACLGAVWVDGVVTGRGHPAGATAGDARHAAAARRSTRQRGAHRMDRRGGPSHLGAHAGRLGRRGGSSSIRRCRRCGARLPRVAPSARGARRRDREPGGVRPGTCQGAAAALRRSRQRASFPGHRDPQSGLDRLLRTTRGPRRGAAGRGVAAPGIGQASALSAATLSRLDNHLPDARSRCALSSPRRLHDESAATFRAGAGRPALHDRHVRARRRRQCAVGARREQLAGRQGPATRAGGEAPQGRPVLVQGRTGRSRQVPRELLEEVLGAERGQRRQVRRRAELRLEGQEHGKIPAFVSGCRSRRSTRAIRRPPARSRRTSSSPARRAAAAAPPSR